MAVKVGEGFGVVGDHGVEVEGLGIGEIGIGDGDGDVGPVGAEPASEAFGVVAGAEVIIAICVARQSASFCVALFAFKLVIVLRAGIGNRSLATEGIKVRVVANNTQIRSNDTGRPE